MGTGKRENGKRAAADAIQGSLPVSSCLHSAPSWNSHQDQMVWRGLRCDETSVSAVEVLFPNYVTTTECVGRAMLNVTKRGFPKPVLENRDINQMCAKES